MVIGRWFKTEWWAEFCLDVLPTGSRVICDPAPENTDEDYLLLITPEVVKPLEEKLLSEGFKIGGSLDKRINFMYKVGDLRWFYEQYPGWESTGLTANIMVGGTPTRQFRFIGIEDNQSILLEFPDQTDPDKKGLFHSWKKGDLNLIITCSAEYFMNFSKATYLSKKLNLLKKDDRIRVFEAVCHDKWD